MNSVRCWSNPATTTAQTTTNRHIEGDTPYRFIELSLFLVPSFGLLNSLPAHARCLFVQTTPYARLGAHRNTGAPRSPVRRLQRGSKHKQKRRRRDRCREKRARCTKRSANGARFVCCFVWRMQPVWWWSRLLRRRRARLYCIWDCLRCVVDRCCTCDAMVLLLLLLLFCLLLARSRGEGTGRSASRRPIEIQLTRILVLKLYTIRTKLTSSRNGSFKIVVFVLYVIWSFEKWNRSTTMLFKNKIQIIRQ